MALPLPPAPLCVRQAGRVGSPCGQPISGDLADEARREEEVADAGKRGVARRGKGETRMLLG